MSVVRSDEAIIDRLQDFCNDGCGIEIRSASDSTWDIRIDYPPGHELADGNDIFGSHVVVDGLGLRSVLLKALIATPRNSRPQMAKT